MKNITLIVFFILTYITTSCTKIQTNTDEKNSNNDSIQIDDEEIVDGLWPDQVGLSQDTVIFSATKDSITIITEYTTWCLCGFDLYETSDLSSNYDSHSCSLEEKQKSRKEGVEVKYEWFTVYSSSADKIIKIKTDENNTGKTRYWRIVLQGGDYFGSIYCQQPSK